MELGPRIMESGADAVFFDTDRMALGFMNYAAAHHIPIPERIAVVGFDDDNSGHMIYPALSTVAHPIEELNRAVIEEECAAYILDKAAQCGVSLADAQVTLQWSTDGYWYPYAVRLVTSGAAENSRLAQTIEADLGIPRARQEWSSAS